MAQYAFRFLGTGSSGGVPRIGNDWGACDPTEPRNRRRRCSALVSVSDQNSAERPTRVLIDTSPDLREQLLDAEVDALDGVVFTHDHADQTHGLDDLRVVALRMRSRLPVHMDAATQSTLLPKFRYCFEGSGGYPAILDLSTPLVPGDKLDIVGPGGGLSLLPLQLTHGRIGCLGFRIGNLAYCNDVSDIPDTTLHQLEGLDILILDALRYSPHPSHANLDQALTWIRHLKPKQAWLTNLHIDMDYQTLCDSLPAGVAPAYDGLTLDFDGSQFPII